MHKKMTVAYSLVSALSLGVATCAVERRHSPSCGWWRWCPPTTYTKERPTYETVSFPGLASYPGPFGYEAIPGHSPAYENVIQSVMEKMQKMWNLKASTFISHTLKPVNSWFPWEQHSWLSRQGIKFISQQLKPVVAATIKRWLPCMTSFPGLRPPFCHLYSGIVGDGNLGGGLGMWLHRQFLSKCKHHMANWLAYEISNLVMPSTAHIKKKSVCIYTPYSLAKSGNFS